MKQIYRMGQVSLALSVAGVLSACSSTPPRNEQLESARALVTQVENSPRAGIAAADITNARRSLNAADSLGKSKSKKSEMEFEATNAGLSAQIAQEKILTAEANEQVANGTSQRQAVVMQAREREVERNAAQASAARQQAEASELRNKALQSELADLKMEKTDRGLVLTLGDVLFDTGGATLKSGAYGTLDRLATALRDQPGRSVVIEGHTDNVGSDENNQRLSERRAQSVQSALMQRGVAASQITATGKGESFPVADNGSASGRQVNRRVELIFAEDRTQIATGR